MSDEIEWPREIWMAELDRHHNGTGMVVLSEHATVARWEGDDERDRDFHGYIDADIYNSAEKYWRRRFEAMEAENKRLRGMIKRAFLEGHGFAQIEAGQGTDMDAIYRRGLLSFESSQAITALVGDE